MTDRVSRSMFFQATPTIVADQGICIVPGGSVSGTAALVVPGVLDWIDVDAAHDTVPLTAELWEARNTSTGALIASIAGLSTGALSVVDGVAGAAAAAPSEFSSMRRLWAARANRASGDGLVRTPVGVSAPGGLVVFLRNTHGSTSLSGITVRVTLGFSVAGSRG